MSVSEINKIMNKFFEAVEKKNVLEAEEIMKHCTQKILDFKGEEVSVLFFLQFVVAARFCSCFSTIDSPEILLSDFLLLVI